MRRARVGWLVWLGAALAAISVGLAAAPLPRRFDGESGLPRPAPVTLEAAAETPASLDSILALRPFGRIARPAEPAPAAQETELGLTLHGVLIAAAPAASRAIVSGPSEPARSYAVGQTIAEAATLVEVGRDRVVLDVGGRRETLSFPKTSGAGGASSAEADEDEEESTDGDEGVDGDADEDARPSGGGLDALRALISDRPAATPRAAEPTDDDDPEPDELEADDLETDDLDPDDLGFDDFDPAESEFADPGADDDLEAVVARYRGRIRDDPQRVLDDLGIVAGEAGYEVGAEPATLLRRAGLEPGDLIAKVNGQQIGDVGRDRSFFDVVVASGRARVEVVRDGQRIVLSFPLL